MRVEGEGTRVIHVEGSEVLQQNESDGGIRTTCFNYDCHTTNMYM